jgi:hypothetical protein
MASLKAAWKRRSKRLRFRLPKPLPESEYPNSKKPSFEKLGFFSSPSWARTSDLRINSPSLYRLSYRGMKSRIMRMFGCLVKSF